MTLRLWWLIHDPENWSTFDGWLASRNIAIEDLPSERFFSLVYFYATQHADENERLKFDARLWLPPMGEEPEEGSPWSAESEKAAFQGFAASVGVKPQ